MRIWPRTVERCLRQCQRAPVTALWKPCGIVTDSLWKPCGIVTDSLRKPCGIVTDSLWKPCGIVTDSPSRRAFGPV